MENIRAVFTGPRQFEWVRESLSLRVLRPTEIVIRSRYALISPGTELAVYTGEHMRFTYQDERRWSYPISMSYATVGVVEQVGESISGITAGDLVFVEAPHQRIVHADPAERIVCKLPPGLDISLAPFAALAAVANTAIRVSPPKAGDWVVVLGLGLVGNLAVQLYQINGANVIAVDLIEARCELAQKCGAAITLSSSGQEPHEEVLRLTGGRGADIVVEATGASAAVPIALKLGRAKGEVILLGSTRGTVDLDVYSLIHAAGRTLRGAHVTVFPRFDTIGESYSRQRSHEDMLELLANGKLIVSPLVSGFVAPHNVQQAYERLLAHRETNLGILIDWARDDS